MEVVKKIKANEIELRDRNTVLRGIKQNVGPSLKPNFCRVITLWIELLWREDGVRREIEEAEGSWEVGGPIVWNIDIRFVSPPWSS